MEETSQATLIQKLNQIGIALTSETNQSKLLHLIVYEARGFTQADAGSLYIREDDNLRFEVAQNDTIDSRTSGSKSAFESYLVPLTNNSMAGYVALTGEILNIEDAYELDSSRPFTINRDFDKRNDYRTCSVLVVPLRDPNGDILGVLQLINAQSDKKEIIPFSPDVEDLVLSMASQAAVAIRNAQLLADIKSIFESLVQYSATAIDARSPHTAGHSRRVAELSLLMAEAINRQAHGAFSEISFSDEQLEELSFAAWLHDIGKIGVPEMVLDKANKLRDDRMMTIRSRFGQAKARLEVDAQAKILSNELSPEQVEENAAKLSRKITELDEAFSLVHKTNQPGFVQDDELAGLEKLTKISFKDFHNETQTLLDDYEFQNLSIIKGNLTDEEYRIIQSHVVHTTNILSPIPFTQSLKLIPVIAASHHEMLNGTGYPNGLTSEDIIIQSRIVSVADVFDALVASDRPYKKAMPLDRALDIIREEAEIGRLDPDVVQVFIDENIWQEDLGA